MAEIAVGAAALFALWFVLRPLADPARVSLEAEEDEAGARRVTALKALVELEEDHAAGKLTDEDLATLRGRYESEAVAALREQQGPDPHDELEAEIAAVKKRLVCSDCGEVKEPGGVCSRCGSP